MSITPSHKKELSIDHSPLKDVPELTHSMVHYLLTIHKLKEQKGFARITDIAKDLKLTKGSVSTAISNLKKKDLVQEEDDCKFVNLTSTGHEEVHRILSSRTLLYYFFKDFLGVDPKIARQDSCMMEHLMSHDTSEKLFHFMKSLNCVCEKGHHQFLKEILPQFNPHLQLCDFDNVDTFIEKQVGDQCLNLKYED
jgi:DtxR family Mn-dependent transcriptional regulator